VSTMPSVVDVCVSSIRVPYCIDCEHIIDPDLTITVRSQSSRSNLKSWQTQAAQRRFGLNLVKLEVGHTAEHQDAIVRPNRVRWPMFFVPSASRLYAKQCCSTHRLHEHAKNAKTFSEFFIGAGKADADVSIAVAENCTGDGDNVVLDGEATELGACHA
jgi:hypothetical protein